MDNHISLSSLSSCYSSYYVCDVQKNVHRIWHSIENVEHEIKAIRRFEMKKYDFEAWETLVTMLVMALVMAVGTLAFVGLVFNVELFAMGGLVVFGWLFGLTGIFFSVILIRNWRGEKH